jgi:hypothetical protein
VEGISLGQYGSFMSKGINGRDGSSRLTGEYSPLMRSGADGRIKKNQLPGVVVINPPKNEYYDTTIEGTKLAFEGASIFSVLEGVYQHFLRPKISETALEWGSRSATMTLITTGVSSSSSIRIELIGSNGRWIILLSHCLDSRQQSGCLFGYYINVLLVI